MRVGIALPNAVPDVITQWAAEAEAVGFACLGTVGRAAFPSVMDTIALAAAAAVTTRIELISHVLLGPVWPPVLLAKEAAGIDGISGGRLTLGLGVGYRSDDFVAEGHGFSARGRRFDADLATYHQVWRGEPITGSQLPAVPGGTREIPLLFGGLTLRAIARAARWGHGFIAAIPSAQSAATSLDQVRTAWRTAGRHESPRLVAITYFGLSDPGTSLADTRYYYYYSFLGEHASNMTRDIPTTPTAVKATVTAFADIGTDQLIFLPGTDNIDDLRRLADTVL